MSTATTTEPQTSRTSSRRNPTQSTNTPTNQLERNAANKLRTTMAAVRLAFTWLGVRKTLASEQRTTAARACQADRELLSASKLILDTKNPAYRAVAAVRSEASSYWRTVTLPLPGAGVRLLPQNSLGLWRTVKYEKVYLRDYADGWQAKKSLGRYFDFYRNERPHQALGYRTPSEVYAER